MNQITHPPLPLAKPRSSANETRRIRVLAITPKLPRATDPGSNAPLLRQIESLRDRGIEVDVIDMHGIPVLKYFNLIPKMRRLLRNVDLVHAHFGFCGWLGRLQFRKPLVVSFMGDDLLGEPTDQGGISRFSRFMVKANMFLARLAKQVVVKSPEMAGVLSRTDCHIVPNGVDTAKFQPMDMLAAREQLGWLQTEAVVLFPGNPDNPRKGYSLAETATSVAAELLDTDIRIQPLWGVRPSDVPLYMNACNAMWMTSLIEGSPNVVKEAMACDRPVVAVPVGDVEFLLADVAGCQIVPRDAKRLGQAMARTLQHFDKSSGREALCRKSLDLESVADRVERVYRAALSSRSPRAHRTDLHQRSTPRTES